MVLGHTIFVAFPYRPIPIIRWPMVFNGLGTPAGQRCLPSCLWWYLKPALAAWQCTGKSLMLTVYGHVGATVLVVPRCLPRLLQGLFRHLVYTLSPLEPSSVPDKYRVNKQIHRTRFSHTLPAEPAPTPAERPRGSGNSGSDEQSYYGDGHYTKESANLHRVLYPGRTEMARKKNWVHVR